MSAKFIVPVGGYLNRVFRSEYVRRGLAGAAASVVVACVAELGWPSKS